MAILGKRKSRDGEAPPSGGSVSELDAEAIFRRHFEAQFEPLDEDEDEDEAARAQREQDDDDAVDSDLNGDGEEDEDGSDEDEWGGFSGEDDEEDDDDEDDLVLDQNEVTAVEVIDHSIPQIPKEPQMSKKELKAFMVCRTRTPSSTQKKNTSLISPT